MSQSTYSPSSAPDGAGHDLFLAMLPTIESIARKGFRFVRCPDQRQDCICEAIAIAWSWYRRLIERGRDPSAFVVTFSRLAARAVACGRRLCGQERIRDVTSIVCRRRHGFLLASLLKNSPSTTTAIEDALIDNTKSPIPAQVQFRCDFSDWKRRLSAKKQTMLELLALGHQAKDVAQVFGISTARVSQIRTGLRRDYLQFLTDKSPK